MSSLIAEAAQQGDEFWRNDDWAMDEGEQDSDSSFESVEEKPDVFDSDFYDSDSDNEEEEQDGESGDEATAMIPRPKVNKYKEPVKKNKVYKEPSERPARKRKASEIGEMGAISTGGSLLPQQAVSARVRVSTKQKTRDADLERTKKQNALVGSFSSRTKSTAKPTFSQKEMLLEALDTEQMNTKWLKIQQMVEDEIAMSQRPLQEQGKQTIRYLSRRGSMPIITFVNCEQLPDILEPHEPPTPASRHGAKYLDPVTRQYYNNIAEFRHLRKKAGIPWNYEKLNL